MAFAVVGGRSVGVPGTLRMLELAHQRLAADPHLRKDPVAAAYFYDGQGQPWPVGHLLKNPELAKLLRNIAAHDSKALLEGPVAQAMVDKVRSHLSNPGQLSLADLAGYQPRQREALCFDHAVPPAKVYRICGFPPPGSGAIAIGQILGLLQQTAGAELPLGSDGLPSADWLHHYTEAARLAFADRAQYVADPDFVAPPAGSWLSLLAPDYLARRARLIAPRSMQLAQPGRPAGLLTRFAPMPEQPEYGTSHVSIVDAQGHAVAMTSTIEDAFGSRQMVKGFLLNNELTDFSFAPRGRGDGRLIQATIAADGPSRMGKRPTGSGGEPSSPNRGASAGVKARHLILRNQRTTKPGYKPGFLLLRQLVQGRPTADLPRTASIRPHASAPPA